jgi:hypothetical protein
MPAALRLVASKYDVRQAREEAEWQKTRRGLADDLGCFREGVAEDVVQDERDALGRCHRFEHDREGHADRLIQGDPVGQPWPDPAGR